MFISVLADGEDLVGIFDVIPVERRRRIGVSRSSQFHEVLLDAPVGLVPPLRVAAGPSFEIEGSSGGRPRPVAFRALIRARRPPPVRF